MDDYGVFADTNDTVRVGSRFVAECFDKQHLTKKRRKNNGQIHN